MIFFWSNTETGGRKSGWPIQMNIGGQSIHVLLSLAGGFALLATLILLFPEVLAFVVASALYFGSCMAVWAAWKVWRAQKNIERSSGAAYVEIEEIE